MCEPVSRMRASSIILSIALLCVSSTVLLAQGSATVRPATATSTRVLLLVDGKVVEAESIEMQRGPQVMVWLRDLENLGWGKILSGENGQVSFKGQGITLTFTKNEGVALVNSLAVKLPIDTYMIDMRLMVPLSFVAKALGYQYECSYRNVAEISTSPVKPAAKTLNCIEGTVTYNGKGAAGIVVRAANRDGYLVENAITKTDSSGGYTLRNLPDGQVMAYAYCADNLGYGNAASELISLSGGQTVRAKPFSVARVLDPLKPKPGGKVPPGKGSAEFAWSPCAEAASYKLVVATPEGSPVFEATCRKPSFAIPTSKLAAGATYRVTVTALSASGDYLAGTAGAGGTPWTFSVSK